NAAAVIQFPKTSVYVAIAAVCQRGVAGICVPAGMTTLLPVVNGTCVSADVYAAVRLSDRPESGGIQFSAPSTPWQLTLPTFDTKVLSSSRLLCVSLNCA